MNAKLTTSSRKANSPASPVNRMTAGLLAGSRLKRWSPARAKATQPQRPVCLRLWLVAGSFFNLRPGISTELLARMDQSTMETPNIKKGIQKISGSASWIIAHPGEKCGRVIVNNMKIVTTITNNTSTALMQAGTYAAVVKAIEPVKNVLKDGEKLELEIEFTVVGATEPMPKRYPQRLDGRSPLRREVQAILGRPLSVPEVACFDTDLLLNRNCLVVVGHQHDPGSEPKAVIKTVLAAPVVIPAAAAASPAVTPTVATA